jgi:acyl dehydratase
MSVFFDDLAVGQTFHGGPLTVTRDDLVAFAVRFDPQPQHLDEEQARASMFGELVASGWHTAALTMRMLVDGASPRVEGGVMGAGIDEIRWPTPVRPGDELSAESEILDMRPSRSRADRGLIKLKTTTRNQDAAVVQVIIANIVVPRRVV